MRNYRSFIFETFSEEETVVAGIGAGPSLRGGDVILLSGGLGAGKTWFTRGLCAGLGIIKGVRSPSFSVIINHIPGGTVPAEQGVETVHHVDLYRLNSGDELCEWGVTDLLADESAVVIVEWGEPLLEYLGDDYILVTIERLKENSSGRKFTVTCCGVESDKCAKIEKRIKAALARQPAD